MLMVLLNRRRLNYGEFVIHRGLLFLKSILSALRGKHSCKEMVKVRHRSCIFEDIKLWWEPILRNRSSLTFRTGDSLISELILRIGNPHSLGAWHKRSSAWLNELELSRHQEWLIDIMFLLFRILEDRILVFFTLLDGYFDLIDCCFFLSSRISFFGWFLVFFFSF